MIREAHDYRVRHVDRICRKLTGRSYSGDGRTRWLRDFPPDASAGDVF